MGAGVLGRLGMVLALAGSSAVVRADEACRLPVAGPAVSIVAQSDGILSLSTGDRLRLAGLDAASLADTGLRGRTVQLAVLGPRDRHGALVGDVVVDGANLRETLLATGKARVRSLDPADPCAASLQATEDRARQASLGLWRQTRYAVRNANDAADMAAANGFFVVAEGTLVHVGVRKRRVYLDFGSGWRAGPTAVMDRDLARSVLGERPEALVGRRIEVRGVVSGDGAPRIDIESALSIRIAGGTWSDLKTR